MKIMRAVGAASLIAALLGIGVFAAQRDDREGKDVVRGAQPTSSIIPQQAESRVLSYTGPGVMWERYDGLVVFARDVEGPWAMSFDLQWDAKRVAAVEPVEESLLDITGWLEVTYDPPTNVLKVHATAEDREAFEAYWLRPRDPRNALLLENYVDEFFEFMHTGSFREEPSTGTVAEETCPGGSCSCKSGQQECRVCCPAGHSPDCNCTSPPRCKCQKVQSM